MVASRAFLGFCRFLSRWMLGTTPVSKRPPPPCTPRTSLPMYSQHLLLLNHGGSGGGLFIKWRWRINPSGLPVKLLPRRGGPPPWSAPAQQLRLELTLCQMSPSFHRICWPSTAISPVAHTAPNCLALATTAACLEDTVAVALRTSRCQPHTVHDLLCFGRY